MPPCSWTPGSEPGSPQLPSGEQEGSAGIGAGHRVAPAAGPLPPPPHLCAQRGTHRARAALRPQSSGTGRQNYPVGWRPPPWGPLPEGQDWASGVGGWPGCQGNPQLPGRCGHGREAPGPTPPPCPAPASCPPRGAPARSSRLARPRSHSLRGRLQGYPRGGGWGSLRPPASSAAFRCRSPFAAPGLLGSKAQSKRLPSSGREVEPGGRQGSRPGGGRTLWLRVPGQLGQARSQQERAVALARARLVRCNLGRGQRTRAQHPDARGVPGP
jgi:hypothetical protein